MIFTSNGMDLTAVVGSVRTENYTELSFLDVKSEKDGLGAYIRFRPGVITNTIMGSYLHLYNTGSPLRVVAVEFVSGKDITLANFRDLIQPRLTERNIQSLWRKYKKLRLPHDA